jgi:cyclopropane fatty-acyl-phospholipid synthase-like methyltransferase
MDRSRKITDWTAYYRNPFFLSHFTRRLGARRIASVLREAGIREGLSFLELGGGNSCMFEGLDALFRPSRYTVIDTNELGLDLMRERAGRRENLRLLLQDLLAPGITERNYDVVFSVGLIEHFDPSHTAQLISRHFEFAKPGGCVLITFPTPTRIYRAARRISASLGTWAFPDERPLEMPEVTEAFERHGRILHQEIGAWTPFTQGLVVGRRASLELS